MKSIFSIASFVVLIFLSKNIFGWNNEVSIGYGNSHEIYTDYNNSGFFLSGMLWKKQVDKTLIFGIDGSCASLHAHTDSFKYTNTFAVSAELRGYFAPNEHTLNPYFAITSGPTYLTQRQLGVNEQGSHLALQSTIGGGVEWMLPKENGIDFNAKLIHYCNAGLASPNHGFEVIMFSVGYLF